MFISMLYLFVMFCFLGFGEFGGEVPWLEQPVAFVGNLYGNDDSSMFGYSLGKFASR